MKRKPRSVDQKALFTRRAFTLGCGKLALSALVLGRLYYLGDMRSGHYKTLANENRVKLQVLLPKRGLILDRNGILLAKNESCYRLLFARDGRTKNIRQTLDKLSHYTDLSHTSLDELYDKIRKSPRHRPVTLSEALTWEDVCRVEVNSLDLPGVFVEEGFRRFYPHGKETAHLVGYVQAPSEKDSVSKAFYRCPDFRLGREGIEKKFDGALRGKAGYKEVEVNALRKEVRQISSQKSVSGTPLRLTLDLELQKFVKQRLKEHHSASVAVLDVHSGEVLSLISTPTFDPNGFTEGISRKAWQKLRQNPYGILNNKSVKGIYPPGSLFKMVVALAGLEAGIISPKTKVFCPGHLDYKGHRYHCWYNRSGHGHMNLEQSLAASCDVYFYEMCQKIGIDRIEKMSYRLGLGSPTGIELPSEKSGLVPSRAWKKKRYNRPWTPGDTILTSIGQGPVLMTPLQMALMAARLVNGGRAVDPSLIQGQNGGASADSFPSLGLRPQHLAAIKRGMDQVLNHFSGTGYRYRISEPGFEMGGKTGTSQVRRISMKERRQGVQKNEHLLWKQRDHALFVGYAPLVNPRYSISVVVDHGGGGGRTATPIARDILLHLQKRERIGHV